MHRIFSPFPELETTRLRIRRLSETDVQEILFLRSDRTNNKYILRQKTKTSEEALQFILRIDKDISEGRSLYWAISLHNNPKLIGVICLWNFSIDHRIAELGFELMPLFQNQGIMQEAVSCVLGYGFEQLGLEIIEAFTHKKNKKSIRLLERNGFTLVPGRKDADYPLNIIFTLSSKPSV